MSIKELPSTEEILTHVYRTDQAARAALEYVRACQGKAGDPEIVLQNLITVCNSLESSFASSGVETFLHRTELVGRIWKLQENCKVQETLAYKEGKAAKEKRGEDGDSEYDAEYYEGQYHALAWMETKLKELLVGIEIINNVE